MDNINVQVRTRKGYTIIWQDINQDLRLKNKDVGLLVRLLGLPPNWRFTEAGLCQRFQIGKYELKNGLKKLEACGYLEREQLRSKDGKFSYSNWTIYDFPKSNDCSPISGFPSSVNSAAKNPSSENQTQLNKNELITKELTTNLSRNKAQFFCAKQKTIHGQIDENCDECYIINACPFPCRELHQSERFGSGNHRQEEDYYLMNLCFLRNNRYDPFERAANNILTDLEERYFNYGDADSNGCLQE